MNMVREPVRDVVRDGLGGNPKRLRLLRKWFAMVRDLPNISRERGTELETSSACECGSAEEVEEQKIGRNDPDREPSRTGPATYQFARWPTVEEAGVLDEDLRYRWEERVAICTIDGGLGEQDGRRVAWGELMSMAGWRFTGCRREQPTDTLAGLAGGSRLNADGRDGPQGVGAWPGSAAWQRGSFQRGARCDRGGNGSEPSFFLVPRTHRT